MSSHSPPCGRSCIIIDKEAQTTTYFIHQSVTIPQPDTRKWFSPPPWMWKGSPSDGHPRMLRSNKIWLCVGGVQGGLLRSGLRALASLSHVVWTLQLFIALGSQPSLCLWTHSLPQAVCQWYGGRRLSSHARTCGKPETTWRSPQRYFLCDVHHLQSQLQLHQGHHWWPTETSGMNTFWCWIGPACQSFLSKKAENLAGWMTA